MAWSFSIVRVLGIDVRIHLTFLLLLGWLGAIYYGQAGVPGLTDGITYILALFGSVLLHEFGHALAARRYGISTPVITLLPIGGVARLERMPDEPAQELVVSIAGPLVNVGIAGLLWLTAAASGIPITGMTFLGGSLLARLLWANLFLAGFNLLPAFPMDGGRVLRALLAMRTDYLSATQTAARVGQAMAFLFGFVGLLFNPILLFIALFVYLGASSETTSTQLREATEGIPVASAMMTSFTTLEPDTALGEAARRIIQSAQPAFPVLDTDGNLQGMLTREDIIKGLTEDGPAAPAERVMQCDVPVVRATAMLQEAFLAMQRRGCPAVPVIDNWGGLVGILTCDVVGEFVMIHGALGQGQMPTWRQHLSSGVVQGARPNT